MANLTLRGIPEMTMSELRARAVCNHRSLNGEILAIRDFALLGDLPPLKAASSKGNPVERQKAALLNAAGGWIDERSEKEIVADIESHRTKGRKVTL